MAVATRRAAKAPSHLETHEHRGPAIHEAKNGTGRVPVGGYVLKDEPIEINAGRPRTKLQIRNTGDRPIQVGSHYHFFEVNRALEFDRERALGLRLDIAAGTAIRFEPGDQREVTLVPFAGKQRVHGFNSLLDGWAGNGAPFKPNAIEAVRRADEYGFRSKEQAATKK